MVQPNHYQVLQLTLCVLFFSNGGFITQLQLVGSIHFLRGLVSLNSVKWFFVLHQHKHWTEPGRFTPNGKCFHTWYGAQVPKTTVKHIRRFHFYWRNVVFMLTFVLSYKITFLLKWHWLVDFPRAYWCSAPWWFSETLFSVGWELPLDLPHCTLARFAFLPNTAEEI